MENKSNQRIIQIFKFFVQFLEIYGQENYGQSAEVDWEKVWNFVNRCGILDNNEELEHLVHYSTDEEFRNNVFSYVEKQALEGYPLWRLFTMSKWLENKCEQELYEKKKKKDVEYFNTIKCYRCKYFHNQIHTIGHTLSEPIQGKRFDNVDELKQYVQQTQYVIQKHWQDMNCMKREDLIKCRHNNGIRRFHNNNYHFRYKGFNVKNDSRTHEWIFNPMKLLDCPYFEENKNMTVKNFEKVYGEIPRYLDEKEV